MRKFLIALVALALTAPLAAQTGPKYGKNGGIGSSTSTYNAGEPAGGTYAINGTTGQETNTITYPGLNVNKLGTSVNVGGCIATDYPSGTATQYTTAAVAGCEVTPSGSYSGGVTWPDIGILGVAVNSSTTKSSVPVFGIGGTTVANSNIYGSNFSTVNCRNYSLACAPGGGFDVTTMYGIEVDTNLYTKAAGADPAGFVAGIVSQLNSDVTSHSGALYGVLVTGDVAHGTKWNSAFATDVGTSNTGLFLNSAGSVSSTSASQAILFTSRTSGVVETSQVDAKAGGVLTLAGATGVDLTGGGEIHALTPFSTIVNFGGTGATFPSSCASGITLGGNFANGGGNEADLINCANSGNGFAFVQKTGASTGNVVLSINFRGTLYAAPQTYAQLPTCNSGAAGALAYITDASAAVTTWHQTISAGGGSAKAIVWCDGANWLAL